MKKRFVAAVLSLLLLTACTPQQSPPSGPSEPPVSYTIIARTEPLTEAHLAEQLKAAGLADVVDSEKTDSFDEWHVIYYLTDAEGKQTAMVEQRVGSADAHDFVRVNMLAPNEARTGVDPAAAEGYHALACALYGEGMDAAALQAEFTEQLAAYDDRPKELTEVALLAQQGEAYAMLTVTYENREEYATPGGERVRVLWIGGEKVYEDGMKPQAEAIKQRQEKQK